tara:strand:- start:3 stop:2507 length:2505 start_codon:yes stop_codon:yes gene_type:complete
MITFLKMSLKDSKKTVSFFLLISLLSIIVTINFLQVDTSTDSLINPELKFKKDYTFYKNKYPVLDKNILIKISSESKEESQKITSKVYDLLKDESEFVNFIFSPSNEKFFEKHFFQFLNNSQKEEFITRLYLFQPFISELYQNPKLEGLNNVLELVKKAQEEDSNTSENLTKLFIEFNDSITTGKVVDWSIIFSSKKNTQYISFGINPEFLEENNFGIIYKKLLEIKKLEKKNTSIDFTGGVLIDFEEISSVTDGIKFAGLLSLFFIAIVLWQGFKQIVIIFSLLISILVGLTITLGLTTITLGSLNLISVSFAILFIGLTVDFGIQICSRFLEKKKSPKKSIYLFQSIKSISITLVTAAIPSMVGFISFVPTDYAGISELGIISCIGLLVGLITNVFFLPSLISIFPFKTFLNQESKSSGTNILYRIYLVFFRFRMMLFFFLGLILFFIFFKSSEITFDSDALNLKDQNLVSVRLAKQLIEENPSSDYIVSVLSEEVISQKISEVLKSTNVKSFFSFSQIINNYDSEELEYLKYLIGEESADFYSSLGQFEEFKNNLKFFSEGSNNSLANSSQILFQTLNNLDFSESSFKKFQEILFSEFHILTNFIKNLGEISLDFEKQIPDFYKSKYLTEDNLQRYEFFPSKDVTISKNLESFVNDIKEIFPSATGMPVVQFEAGKIVIDSFKYAFLFSIIFLFVYVYLIFRSLKYLFLTFSCLFFASILTLSTIIFFNLKINFANMIALPLLYSLGISYPIYYLKRYYELKNIKKVFNSNTPSAIFLSAATTICSFSSLALSSHNGTASMGILLFISLTMTFFSALVILPILIQWIYKTD